VAEGTPRATLTVTDNVGVKVTAFVDLMVLPTLTPIKCIGIVLTGTRQCNRWRIAGTATVTDGSNRVMPDASVSAE
jgi:hypothetical protein